MQEEPGSFWSLLSDLATRDKDETPCPRENYEDKQNANSGNEYEAERWALPFRALFLILARMRSRHVATAAFFVR